MPLKISILDGCIEACLSMPKALKVTILKFLRMSLLDCLDFLVWDKTLRELQLNILIKNGCVLAFPMYLK